jgi:hypothetical protein
VGGERAGNRTPNLVVKSHLLCQLSYAPRRKLEARALEIKPGLELNLGNSFWGAKATASRSLDPELITLIESNFRSPRETFGPSSTLAQYSIDALRSGSTALEAKGSTLPSLRQERDDDGPEESISTNDSVSTAMCTRASRADTNSELQQPNRKARFEDLWVGDAGIGHVGVDRGGSRRERCRTRAAPDRFVVAKILVTEGHVVHRSLACCRTRQRAEQHVDDPLRRFDVPADDCRSAGRIENRSSWNRDLDRIETASIQGDAFRNE